uniref:FXYD domain-containing ion transport regulator n=1 Tax=Seriola dumerili TaxID=41447 RepID=A0A3B4UCQ2_SERDU
KLTFYLSDFLSVLFSLFMETEANYERLRIGGLVCASFLVAGGLGVLLCKKAEDDSSEI